MDSQANALWEGLRSPPLTHREQLGLLPGFVSGEPSTLSQRAALLDVTGRELILGLHRGGNAGISTGRLITELMDRLLRGLWAELLPQHAVPTGLSLVALGSYGRRELSPRSDLDLLLVYPDQRRTPDLAPLARALQHALWDLKLQLGFSVRSFGECASIADQDHTVRTALMDARPLAGSGEAYALFRTDVLDWLKSRKVDGFIAAKAQELKARREKYGDSVFVLEPHLKSGEGGLRDLETALWVGEARYRVHGLTGLLQQSLLPPGEVERLRWARDLLLRCRHQLHFSSGKKEDRLTFERQEQMADFLGYRPLAQRLPVEQFMRHYYLAASAIRQAADALIDRVQERVQESEARVSRLFSRRLGRFRAVRGKVTLGEDAEQLRESPERMLEILQVADEAELELASHTRDQLSQAVDALSSARGKPEVVEAFKALFARPGTRGKFLTPMHQLGLLGAVLPEFGRITAFHQHDLYHVYTVDVHSLFALRRLYALRVGDLLQEQPEFTREMQALEDPLPLYLGMIFHDAGKGMGGSHSLRGQELMAQVGERLGLSDRQRAIAEFLVLHHLLMSHTAQRRDLSDPRLIQEFASTVGDLEKLSCLYLLSYADIASVGPAMWNQWKGRLLKELYDKARAALGGEVPGAENSGPTLAFREVWRQRFGEGPAEQLVATLPSRYFTSTDPDLASLHGRMLFRAERARRKTEALLEADRDADPPFLGFRRRRGDDLTTELTLLARDRPGLLALFAGVLSAYRIDILRARIASTRDGYALDVFDVRGPGGLPLEPSKWRSARTDLRRVLRGEVSVDDVLRKRRGTDLLRKHLPPVKTQVQVDNQTSRDFTVVDVQAEDQVGLLHAVASALHHEGAQIALAQVSTEANRATDSFYLTTAHGKITAPEAVQALIARVEEALAAR